MFREQSTYGMMPSLLYITAFSKEKALNLPLNCIAVSMLEVNKYDISTGCKWDFEILKKSKDQSRQKTLLLMSISKDLVHMKWKKNIPSVREICLFTSLLLCFSITPWDVRINKTTCFWISVLFFCATQFPVMAPVLYEQTLNDRVIHTAGFPDRMCSFKRCFLLLKPKRFHSLCSIYSSQALIWPLCHSLWALHNILLEYSHFTSRETGHWISKTFTVPLSACFSHLA